MEIWLWCFIKDILLIEMPVDQVVTNANIDTAKTLTGDTLFITFQSFIILFFRKWYVFSMNCFNAKLMIAPLVHIATKKRKKKKRKAY